MAVGLQATGVVLPYGIRFKPYTLYKKSLPFGGLFLYVLPFWVVFSTSIPAIFASLFMKNSIISIIDLFYPPFKRMMPLQTFRYAACGGFNVLLGFAVFTLVFKNVVKQQVVDVGVYAFEPYSIALIISSAVVFIVGFLLSKYVVFTTSNLKGRIQLFRYFLSFLSNLAINYVLLKLLVKYLQVYPVLAQIIVTAMVIVFSYFTQQYFTFKIKKDAE
jgi:putative flippase GtrA